MSDGDGDNKNTPTGNAPPEKSPPGPGKLPSDPLGKVNWVDDAPPRDTDFDKSEQQDLEGF